MFIRCQICNCSIPCDVISDGTLKRLRCVLYLVVTYHLTCLWRWVYLQVHMVINWDQHFFFEQVRPRHSEPLVVPFYHGCFFFVVIFFNTCSMYLLYLLISISLIFGTVSKSNSSNSSGLIISPSL